MEKHSGVFSYLAGGGTFLGGLLTMDVLVGTVGMLLGIGTFWVNWYYRRKEYRLKERMLERDSCTD